MERVKLQDAKVSPGRAQKALNAGPHGKDKNADGTANSSSNPHGFTSGGNNTPTLKAGETYRVGEHYTPHLNKKDLPPAPKGQAAINLDSDYAKPQGPATTRTSKRSDGVASVPSAGGTVRAPKDSANCDDSLGSPESHHGEHQQAKVQSGRGPAAAKRQAGRNWLHGTLDADGKTT